MVPHRRSRIVATVHPVAPHLTELFKPLSLRAVTGTSAGFVFIARSTRRFSASSPPYRAAR